MSVREFAASTVSDAGASSLYMKSPPLLDQLLIQITSNAEIRNKILLIINVLILYCDIILVSFKIIFY